MRIGIDARMVNESGIGRYLRNLLVHLQKLDKDNEYYIFLRKEDFLKLKFGQNFTKILANFQWYGVKEQIRFPQLLGQYKLDLVHFPHFNIPILYGCRFVVTIHDLIHQHFQIRRTSTLSPVTFRIKTYGYKLVFKKAVSRSVKILTPTKFVKEQLIDEWKVNPDKIVVTPEAVEEEIIKLSQKKMKSLIKGDYLFYIGNVHPHKNIKKLIEAFKIIRQKRPGLKLVLSGKENHFWRRLKDEHHEDGVVYTGYVSDEQMVGLYKYAQAFVMPSLEEGFGIPVLEAMACNCPVVASDIGVIREVGGKAVAYFDPKDEKDMAEKIKKVISSKTIGNKLISLGKDRYQDFSWEKLARQTLEVYYSCV